MFKKIDHVEIVTDEPQRSVGFYTRVLGFEEKLRQEIRLPDTGGTLEIVYLDLGGTGIELLTYRGVPKEPAPQKLQLGYRLMALEVALQAQDIAPSWGPVRIAKYTRAEIRDPDGYSIELREWHRPLPGRAEG
jgi:catechol 2,3-dioxygenase-like lactoylglutathione lyase family enzyme